MAAYRNGELIEGSVGRTVRLYADKQYMGDGDTLYNGYAVIEKDDGTYHTTWAGNGGGWYNTVDFDGSELDGDVLKYRAHLDAEAAKLDVIKKNIWHYKLEAGKTVIVTRGKRKRKAEGRSGFVFWVGENRYGPAVGIEDESGDRFFVPTYQVQVVPPAEEQIGV